MNCSVTVIRIIKIFDALFLYFEYASFKYHKMIIRSKKYFDFTPYTENSGYLIAQLRNMKFVLEEIDLINDLVDYRQEQIQMLSKIIPQFEDVLPT